MHNLKELWVENSKRLITYLVYVSELGERGGVRKGMRINLQLWFMIRMRGYFYFGLFFFL